MALQYGLTSIPMTGGVDTRTDSKALKPPRLAVCKNVRFTSPGKHQKRQGYSRIAGSPNSGVGEQTTVVFLGNKISALASDGSSTAFRYDSHSDKWQYLEQDHNHGVGNNPSPGQPTPVTISVDLSSGSTRTQVAAPSDVTDQYIWGSYRAVVSGCSANLNATVTVYDRHTSGAILALDGDLFDFGRRLLGLGDNLISLGLDNHAAPANFSILTWNVAARVTPTLPVGVSASSSVIFASDGNATKTAFDCCMTRRGVLFAYSTSTAGSIKVIYLNTNGTIDASTTLTTGAGNALACLGICFDSITGKIGVVAYDNTATKTSHWLLNENLSVSASAVNTTPTGFIGWGTPAVNFCTAHISSGSLFGVWEVSAAQTYDRRVNLTKLIGSTATYIDGIFHASLASKAASDGVHGWVVLSYISAVQKVFIFYNAVDMFTMCGRFQSGLVAGVSVEMLPTLQYLGSDTYAYPALSFSSDPTLTQSVSINVTIDTSPDYTTRSFDGSNSVVSGGLPLRWDGVRWKEQGFTIFPENVSGTSSAGGPLLPITTYSYLAVYDTINSQGYRERSTFGDACLVTTGAGHGNTTITVPYLTHTLDNTPSCRVSLYRAAQGGTVYHYLASAINSKIISGYVTFNDVMAEANLILRPELDNVSLDPVPLPNCTIVTSGNTRIYASGLDNPDEVLASKFLDGTYGVFNDALTIMVPSTGTPITAIATLGDELIAFKESHIYSVAGDGPDDTGAGGTFDVPRTITNSLGCTNPRSLVLVPSGLMFQSGKGIYLLGADHSLQYIGADVEDFNSEVITSAVALPFNNEVRFQTASRTLVYDYVQQTWSEWTIKGVEAFLYQGKYTYRETSTGPLLQEIDGFFLDVDQTYQMEIETPWMTTAGAQGSQSVLALYFLGDYKSKHMARVRISYNYEDGLAETVYWDPVPVVSASLGTLQGMNTTGTNSTGVYQYMVRVPHPKCQSIKVNVCDVSEGGEAPQEAFALTEIALLTATKVGPMKLGKEKRTG